MNRTAFLAAALLLAPFASSAAGGLYTADELRKTYIPELLTEQSGIKGAEAPADGVLKVAVGQAEFDRSLSRDDTALFLASALCRAYEGAGLGDNVVSTLGVWHIILGYAAVLSISLMASLWGAWQASVIEPGEALRSVRY